MAVRDVSADLKKMRNKKKAVKFLKRFIIIGVVAVLALAAVLTRSLWYPKLDGILTKIPVTEDVTVLAEGYFPLKIEGGSSYELEGFDNGFCVLDDSKFFSYNLDGKLNYSAQHSFAVPVLKTSAKKALIYDLGGKSFSLMSKYKTMYSVKTENPILYGCLSSNDMAAVVTKSDKFMAEVMIYDVNGNNIFNYSSISRIINVCFNADNNGCYITTSGSKGGALVSQILYYRFDKIDYDALGNPVPVWNTDYIETLVIDVKLFGDGNVIVVGDTLCCSLDKNGSIIETYDYDRDLKSCHADSNIAALVFDDNERRCSTLVTFNASDNEINEISLDYMALKTTTANGYIYVQSNSGIIAYDSLGNVITETELDTDYDSFKHIDKYIYLLGYDEINRINFS